MTAIFISYSWSDSTQAQRIAESLVRQGYWVWIDYQNLNLKQPLAPQLARAIWQTDLFLCVDSSHSRSSPWVQFELLLARIWDKSIRMIYLPN